MPLLDGDVPSPINPPPGCTFHTRCSFADAHCRQAVPALRQVRDRMVRCHRAEEIWDQVAAPPAEVIA
jgi:dipeptide transport system ATP-binding protein